MAGTEETAIEVNVASVAISSSSSQKTRKQEDSTEEKIFKLWSWEPKNIYWWISILYIWGSICFAFLGFSLWAPANYTYSEDSLVIVGTAAFIGGGSYLIGSYLSIYKAIKDLNIDNETGHSYYPPPSTSSTSSSSSSSSSNISSTSLASSSSALGTELQTLHNLQEAFDNRDETTNAGRPTISRNLSEVSDSYNPHNASSSYIESCSKTTSVTSMTSASDSYNSDLPEQVVNVNLPQLKKERGVWFRDIGFVANLIFFIGGNIYFIACITGMYGVLDFTNVGHVQGLYITPQVVGALGFTIASLLYILQAQPKWYIIQPTNLAWLACFCNLVGSIGFTLCGIFGYYQFAGLYQRWGSSFSICWGSLGFLFGSYLQLLMFKGLYDTTYTK